MIILQFVVLILIALFFYFGVAMMLDKGVSATKLMLIGMHISIIGVGFQITETSPIGRGASFVAIVGFLFSLITFVLDNRND